MKSAKEEAPPPVSKIRKKARKISKAGGLKSLNRRRHRSGRHRNIDTASEMKSIENRMAAKRK